jgi:O-antigen ligase
MIACLIPRLTWLLLPIVALTLITAALRQGGSWRELIQPNALWVVVALIVVAYVFVNATWAVDRAVGFAKAALLFWVVLITFVAGKAVAELKAVVQVRRAALSFAVGAFVGTLLILFELLTHGAITRLAMNSVDLLHHNPKHMKVTEGGHVSSIKLSALNQNVAVSMFNFWPALSVLRSLIPGSRRRLLVSLFFILMAATVFVSKHQSSQMALVGSVFVFFIASAWPQKIVRPLAAVWCLAFVLIVPLSFFAYKTELHMASSLPDSARARIIIWEYTAEQVLEHPWLGIGADSTRALNRRKVAEQPEGFVVKRTTAWHAHDLFLQVWFELGFVGVILMALSGAMIVAGISVLPLELRPHAAAMFAVFMTIAAFAWGIWQTWLICSIALMLLYFAVATRWFIVQAQPASKKNKTRTLSPSS